MIGWCPLHDATFESPHEACPLCIDEMAQSALARRALTHVRCFAALDAAVAGRERHIIQWLRAPNEDGTACSVEREILAQRLEKGEHLK